MRKRVTKTVCAFALAAMAVGTYTVTTRATDPCCEYGIDCNPWPNTKCCDPESGERACSEDKSGYCRNSCGGDLE